MFQSRVGNPHVGEALRAPEGYDCHAAPNTFLIGLLKKP